MSIRAQLKNFFVNGGDSTIFKSNLYELFGYLDLDEKGYFTKEDLFEFLGFQGPIAEDIWRYFCEDPDNENERIDFLKFKKGLKLLQNNEKPVRGISREIVTKKMKRRNVKKKEPSTPSPIKSRNRNPVSKSQKKGRNEEFKIIKKDMRWMKKGAPNAISPARSPKKSRNTKVKKVVNYRLKKGQNLNEPIQGVYYPNLSMKYLGGFTIIPMTDTKEQKRRGRLISANGEEINLKKFTFLREGKGKLQIKTGDCILGTWIKDKLQGPATLIIANKDAKPNRNSSPHRKGAGHPQV